MAKHHHSDAPDVIEEFESAAERMAQWVSANRWLALGTLALMLGVTAGIGGFRAWHERREAQAANPGVRIATAWSNALASAPIRLSITSPWSATVRTISPACQKSAPKPLPPC